MKRKCYLKESTVLCFAFSLILIPSAHAYVDPGAGSKILQVVIASVVTIGLTVKLFWHKLLKILGIRGKNSLEKNESHVEKK